MNAYPVTLANGRKLLHGHMFVGDDKLYFVCTRSGSLTMDALGGQVGGLVGGALKALGNNNHDAADIDALSEADIAEATQQTPGGFILPAAEAEKIHYTMWARYIKWNGKKLGAGKGLSADLQRALNTWAQRNGVATKGLKS